MEKKYYVPVKTIGECKIFWSSGYEESEILLDILNSPESGSLPRRFWVYDCFGQGFWGGAERKK